MKELLVAKIPNYTIDEKKLLEDILMTLAQHELIVILGKNGAGKSTLLKHLSGEIKNKNAQIKIKDKLIEQYSTDELANQRAVLTQENHPEFDLTVYELVEIGRYSSNKKNEDSIIRECLSIVGLGDKAFQNYSSLSGGEKQRAHIARTLAQIFNEKEAIYLLDEPTNSLDVANQYEIMNLIKEMTKIQLGAVIILHDLNLAAQFADKIILLDEGKIVAFGKPNEVLSAENIMKTYGHNVVVLEHPTLNFPLIVSNYQMK